MCNFLRVFLPKDHPYRREAYDFNGKPEGNWRPNILSPIDWLRTYDINKDKEIS
jgi:hypothetical protein